MGFFKKLEKALRPPKPGTLPHEQVKSAFAGPSPAPVAAAPVQAAPPQLTRAQRIVNRRAALPQRTARIPVAPTGPALMANGGEVGRKTYGKK